MFPGSVGNSSVGAAPSRITPADNQDKATQGAGAKISQVSNSASSLAPAASDSRQQFITLKNGAEVPLAAVRMTMLILEKYVDTAGSVALYELNEKCKDAQYQMLKGPRAMAERFALTEGGKVLDLTRNIILSSIEGEGLDLRLTNPVDFFPRKK